MLRLVLGRAKTGKTAAVMEEIRARCAHGTRGAVLLVPEQYSHEAERELLRVCGDSLSLYAEVLSFTRLASRVESELGYGSHRTLDKGGRALCLARALDATGARLRTFGAARRQTALQQALLRAIDECKTGCIPPEALRKTAESGLGAERTDSLREKLTDLALVYEAYEAIAAQSGLDPMDDLTRLAG
ncbi:MAG: ATP-dependent nuclease subunit B, partial [Oscillospiraceae bacterium]|nr:ATP-dependent nuclease subunit B [Oscillospiraceae bacterium]